MSVGPARLAGCLAAAALAVPPGAPGVSAELAAFWRAHLGGSADVPMLAAKLDHVVRTGLGPDGLPVREAVRLVAGDPARAWAARLALLDADVPAAQRSFVQTAVHEYDAAYAAAPRTVTTTIGEHGAHSVAALADGDPATYYWSAGPAVRDAAVTVDLGAPRSVHGVRVALGKPDRPRDHLHDGALEFSPDGSRWRPVARLDGPEHDVRVRADVRYLRLRSTADQPNWLVVRELAVVPCPSDRAADGDPSTVFTVTGPALELPLPADAAASAIVVRAGLDTERGGQVQVRMDGGRWATLGRLAGAYTELPVPAGRATRVRIVPGDGPRPLVVHEVTARRAG